MVAVPGAEIITALKSGAIDASEWVGPWLDVAAGLAKVADYYYYPGFHEPGTSATLGINLKLWDGLSASERALIETAAAAEFTLSLAQFNVENVRALKLLAPIHGSRSLASTTNWSKRSASSARTSSPILRQKTR